MRVEKIAASVVFLVLLLHLFNVQGTGPFVIIFTACLSMLYFPGSFYFFSYKTLKNQIVALSVVSGLCASILIMGLLFKAMYWMGAMPMILISCVTIPIFTLIVWLVGRNPKEELAGYFRNMKIRFTIFTFLAIVLYVTPSKSLIRFQYRNQPRQAELLVKMHQGLASDAERKEFEVLRSASNK